MPAKIGFVEIPAREPKRLSRFLRRVFGWAVEAREWSGGSYLIVSDAIGDAGCGIFEAEPAELSAPMPVVHVDSSELGPCLDRVGEAGGRVIEAPRRIDDYGTFARFEDSEGNVWGVWAASARESVDERDQGAT